MTDMEARRLPIFSSQGMWRNLWCIYASWKLIYNCHRTKASRSQINLRQSRALIFQLTHKECGGICDASMYLENWKLFFVSLTFHYNTGVRSWMSKYITDKSMGWNHIPMFCAKLKHFSKTGPWSHWLASQIILNWIFFLDSMAYFKISKFCIICTLWWESTCDWWIISITVDQ